MREQPQDSIMKKAFNIFHGGNLKVIKALQNINLEIKEGDRIGIIGANGSGKSTLLRILMGAFPPDKGGSVSSHGKILRLALGMGFDPNLTARENIYVNGSMIGLTMREIGQKLNSIVTFSEQGAFIDTPIKFFSSGMVSKLAFSVAMHADADIYLFDEFFGGVGDERFREKSNKAFSEFVLRNKTYVLVSHDLETIEKHTDQVVYLQKGEIVEIGTPASVIRNYLKETKVISE